MEELLRTAMELVRLMDMAADKTLPKQIVDIVKLHSKLAVGSAWIPVPGADIAAGAASIWGMYIRINKKINIPFGENVMKSIGVGVATNLISYVAMSGVASALKCIPGIGTITGGVIMSASLYAMTLVSGWVYLKALCTMVKRDGMNLSAADLKEAVNQVLSDKAVIKRMFNMAKKEYKS